MKMTARTAGSDRWVATVAMSLVVVGCAVRFAGLGHGVVWLDEGFTGLRISGAPSAEVARELYDSGAVTPSRLLEFQFPRPGSSWLTTVRELVRNDPKQVPLYYVLARWWVVVFGPSVAVTRSLSAAAGVLVLPLLFLLGSELFGDRRAGWIAAALTAVSPVHVVYSQEARPYSLWVLMTVFSSWVLLVAARRSGTRGRPNVTAFAAYGAAVVLGLTTHVLFVLVVVAHLVLVAWQGGWRVTPALRGVGWSLLGAAALSSPLAVRVIQQLLGERTGLEWVGASIGLRDWTVGLATAYSRAFVDLGGPHLPDHLQLLGVVPLALVLVAVPAVWRHAPRTAARFLLLLALCCSLPLVLTDLMVGGIRATVIRYHLPGVVAGELAVALWTVVQLRSGAPSRRRFGIAVFSLLAVAGIASALVRARTEVWWNKPGGREIVAAAAALDGAQKPLLLSGGRRTIELLRVLALAHRLEDHVMARLGFDPAQAEPLQDDRQLYAWNPSDDLLETLAGQGWGASRVAATQRLYLLGPPPRGTAAGDPQPGRAGQ